MSAPTLDTAKRWLHKDAEWWQFWLPQSGPVGGMIMGVILASFLAALP
jgi:glycerol uptake facilitator-like aquaporin